MAGDDRSMHDLVAALRASGSGASYQQLQQSSPATSQQRHSNRASPLAGSHPSWTSTHLGSSSQQQQSQGAVLPGHATEEVPDRTANLLNLLRFSQNGQPRQTPSPGSQHSPAPGIAVRSGSAGFSGSTMASSGGPATQNIHGRGVSASDLVASFMGKPSAVGANPRDVASPATAPSPAPSANPQDYLLQLLNRSQIGHRPSSPAAPLVPSASTGEGTTLDSHPRGSQDDDFKVRKESTLDAISAAMPGKESSQESAQDESSQPTSISPKPEPTKNPIFTYVNPFEQLAASSPRNRSGASTPRKDVPSVSRFSSDATKFETKHHTQDHRLVPDQEELSSARVDVQDPLKLKPAPSDSIATGIGAPTTDSATVAQALSEVSEQVSRQADFALARAEEENDVQKSGSKSSTPLRDNDGQDTPVTAVKLKKEPSEAQEHTFDSVKSQRMRNTIEKSTADVEPAHGEVQGSADDEKSSANGEVAIAVPVYNFVMKPFVLIDILQTDAPTMYFREDTITEIARLKKDFDQIDRTLTTASAEYIIYSLPKSGGIRVIRQEDGHDRQIFKETKDHVFNVSISTAARGKSAFDLQTSIATASSGTVYWTALHSNGDNLDSDNLLEHSLIFPPVSPNDEHSAGGQLKTRAKRSSRHPEFFAIGRGKLIQVIFPLHAARSTFMNEARVIDTDGYFKDRSLKINTGKAGKDFTFSEDDTVIATLDKAGRLRFWDIRELIHDSNSEAPVLSPIEIRTPILTLATAMPTEKSWPTSVLFVDKMRAYAKGTALRYVIVGMKQNHTLQLWDLGIGKAIQEVHFPHSNESDAICSVCYHPASGIIVVGHPTRNSIYFIHLSAPKYNLPAFSQARYLTRLADKDSTLPKLEATAIMSGMREYSFASRGQLRSVDLLPVSPETLQSKEQPGLFELYVMHSKGVTMLSIHREDLGWSEDMKVLHPVNAEEEGVIRIKELVQPPAAVVSENSSINGDVAPTTASSKKNSTSLTKVADKGTTDDTDHGENKERGIHDATISSDKTEKRKKKKNTQRDEEFVSLPPPAPVAPAFFGNTKVAHFHQSAGHGKESVRASTKRHMPEISDSKSHNDPITLDISTDFIDRELKRVEVNVSEEFKKALERELSHLYKRISEDKQVRDAQYGADREALLRLISKHLGQNLEAALARIVSESMERQLLPSFQEAIAATLHREMNNLLSKNLSNSVSKELLPGIRKTLHSSEWLGAIAAGVTQKSGESAQHTRELLHETETRINHNVRKVQLQLSEDSTKIDHLTKTIESLQEAIQSMVATQSHLSQEISALKGSSLRAVSGDLDTFSESSKHRDSETCPEDSDLHEITRLMAAGKVEDATVKWLQSKYQGPVFDRFFVGLDPHYIRECSPLVTLSVAAAVTASLENHLGQKLRWLDVILSSINHNDPDIRDVAPKIMNVLYQRLEARHIQLGELEPRSPNLNHMLQLMRKAREIGQTASRT